ncbi:amino acid permease [Prescottella equi]|uniref:Uncharacterized protein n=2 Tax=Rhodococcus hoagii TaxID=43767 RepID=E9T5T4_RHOHA|nr:hypothetical protein [Prescottella equi]EGD22153.1 hypothetical protein HMPREF0724_14140 [Prescottella equi ATCC 33707]MBM4481150.1 amino acid permease [Prescottella equi]MBM4487634.1 amino acid permease [Prescottella equi]MBM4488415.1 amino acid permease [Prescottella equi]MBM4499595.1 amino acid permease [Prescottella equi]
MAWLVLVARGVVVLVAVTVLPRRGRLGRAPGFPWFWVVLPVMCIAVAAILGVLFRPEIVTHASSIWWDRPGTGSPGPGSPHEQFLSAEQFQRYTMLRRMRLILPAVSVVGIGLAVGAWRRRRI